MRGDKSFRGFFTFPEDIIILLLDLSCIYEINIKNKKKTG